MAWVKNALRSVGEILPINLALLILSWVAAALFVIYGLTQVTPAGPARQFVLYAGTGMAIALLGWRLFSVRGPQLAGDTAETRQDRDTRWTRDTMLAFSSVGIAGSILYAIRYVVPPGPVESLFRVAGALTLIACGSMLSGALLGFLFGIPRAQQGRRQISPSDTNAAAGTNPPGDASDAARTTADSTNQVRLFDVNTNLEEISDWLTKIIVGLGLINLEKFPSYLHNLAAYFAPSLGDVTGREGVVLAVLILFSVCGFLLAYLLTRLFLTGAFTRAEESVTEQLNKALKEASRTGSAGRTMAGPGPSQVAAIQRVQEAASAVSQDEIAKRVSALATEYAVTRSSMLPSPERTRQMDGIVVRMKGLAKDARWMLPELTRSASAGERLAAVAFLQMEADPRYVQWLGNRFVEGEESPFTKYHAARALQRAVEDLGRSHADDVHQALDKADKAVPPGSDSNTRALLDAAKAMANKIGIG